MDYTELAKRLRDRCDCDFRPPHGPCCDDTAAADAIEALTSPPDEAQVDALVNAYEEYRKTYGPGRITGSFAFDAVHRVRVKKEAT